MQLPERNLASEASLAPDTDELLMFAVLWLDRCDVTVPHDGQL